MDAAATAAANRSSPGSAGAVTPGASAYADPGYLPDGKKRYPLDTEEHVKAAASYFPRYKGRYTPQQQNAIASKIAAAEKRLGIGGGS